MFWLLRAVACSPVPAEPADVELHATCVGTGEHVSLANGDIDQYYTHRLGVGWSEHVTADVDHTYELRLVEVFDDAERPLSSEYWQLVEGLAPFVVLRKWTRDPDGLLLESTVESTDGYAIHEDFFYEDGLLTRKERRVGFDGDFVTWEDYAYDADRRLAEATGQLIGRITYTYFAPAPSMNHRATQYALDDGPIENTSATYLDVAGRLAFTESTHWSGTYTSEAHLYGPTGAETFALSTVAEADGDNFRYETRTERDSAGHPLFVEQTGTTDIDGTVTTTIAQTTWAWACDG